MCIRDSYIVGSEEGWLFLRMRQEGTVQGLQVQSLRPLVRGLVALHLRLADQFVEVCHNLEKPFDLGLVTVPDVWR